MARNYIRHIEFSVKLSEDWADSSKRYMADFAIVPFIFIFCKYFLIYNNIIAMEAYVKSLVEKIFA